MDKSEKKKILLSNRKARFEYEILETYEAGISLLGTEVKSLRQANANFLDSYARIKNNEIFVMNLNISEYKYGNIQNHEPTRVRRLLMKKQEIKKLEAKMLEKGLTVVPLTFYLKNGKIKLEIGLCRGKKLYDKRETIKKRDIERSMDGY